MKKYDITTQKAVRELFWQTYDQLDRRKRKDGSYPTDTRVCFVDFVDALAREGTISQALASRATL